MVIYTIILFQITFCNDSDIESGSGSGYRLYHCDPIILDSENVTMTMGSTIQLNITRQLVDGNIRLTITGEASLEIYQVDINKCQAFMYVMYMCTCRI